MTPALRGKIPVIASATVIGTIALSGAATYTIVRANMLDTIDDNLNLIATSNTTTIG